MANPTDPVNINGNWWHYDATTRTHRPAELITKRADRNQDMAAIPAAVKQRAKRKASTVSRKDCAISKRVDIEIRSFRVHTCDTEAVFVKHAIDAIVDRGVIANDSAKEVASIKFYAAEKADTRKEEGHLITLRVAQK
jgi:hypothetical protein